MARNKSEVSYNFKIDFDGIDPEKKEIVKKKVGELLIQRTLNRLKAGQTPIDKGEFHKKLSDSYKSLKGSRGQKKIATMKLDGDMLNQLKATGTKNGVKIEIKGKEAAKAFAHHTSYRGHPTIKDRKSYKREFIPNKGQKYKTDILKAVDRIIDSHRGEEDGER